MGRNGRNDSYIPNQAFTERRKKGKTEVNTENTRQILVTGGAGFLGSHVVETLHARGHHEVFVPRSREYDLTILQDVKRLLRNVHPHIITG